MSARRIFAQVLIGFFLLALPLLVPLQAHAQSLGNEWGGVCVGGTDQDVATIQGFECLLANILTVFIAVVGLSAFVMIIVAAFRYLLSGGNTKSTEQARSTITWAVIGIVVLLSAFIILNLLTAFTGVDLTQFKIPRSTDEYFYNGVPSQPGSGGTGNGRGT